MLMMQKMQAVRSGSGPLFPVNAVALGGSDYLLRGAGLTGQADSASGTFHCFFKTADGDGRILNTDGGRVVVGLNLGRIQIILQSSGGSQTLSYLGNTVGAHDDGLWHSLLASWNTGAGAGSKFLQVYADDVADGGSITDGSVSFNVDNSESNWGIGATTAGANTLVGDIAQVYYRIGSTIDFSVEANRRKFISADNRPVDLGANGSLPTGTQPIIFLNNPAASFGTNKGSGGDFTVTGTLTDASTRPSD